MKDLWSKVFKKNKDIVTRIIDEETILIPVFRKKDDISAIYTLNKTANLMWELIDGKRSLSKIRNILLDKYNVDKKKLNSDILKFIEELKEIKVIV